MTLEEFKKEASERLNIKNKDIKRETRLVEDLSLDSIDAIDLIIGIEDKLEIKFEDEKITQLKTVGDFLDYVNQLISSKEA